MSNIEGRILIVEDQRDWQVEIKDLLRDHLYDFKVADKFQKALDYLNHHTFDLVLLDLRLTDWAEGTFEGWDLMEKILELKQERGTQVIIISAYGETEHVREGFKKYRIADYIDKKRLDPIEFQQSVGKAIKEAYRERGDILDNYGKK